MGVRRTIGYSSRVQSASCQLCRAHLFVAQAPCNSPRCPLGHDRRPLSASTQRTAVRHDQALCSPGLQELSPTSAACFIQPRILLSSALSQCLRPKHTPSDAKTAWSHPHDPEWMRAASVPEPSADLGPDCPSRQHAARPAPVRSQRSAGSPPAAERGPPPPCPAVTVRRKGRLCSGDQRSKPSPRWQERSVNDRKPLDLCHSAGHTCTQTDGPRFSLTGQLGRLLHGPRR